MIPRLKKKNQKHPYKKMLIMLGGVCLLLIATGLVVASINMYQKKRELSYQVKSLENKMLQMQQKNQELKQGIAKSDDEQYIEKVAREELDLQKPGEKVFSFIRAEKEASAEVEQSVNFWQAWVAWVAGIVQW